MRIRYTISQIVNALYYKLESLTLDSYCAFIFVFVTQLYILLICCVYSWKLVASFPIHVWPVIPHVKVISHVNLGVDQVERTIIRIQLERTIIRIQLVTEYIPRHGYLTLCQLVCFGPHCGLWTVLCSTLWTGLMICEASGKAWMAYVERPEFDGMFYFHSLLVGESWKLCTEDVQLFSRMCSG